MTGSATATTVTDRRRYTGKVVKVLPGESCGFIGMTTITNDGSEPIVTFARDVFVHQDDLANTTLKEGMEVGFSIVPDTRRGGEGNFRAVDVHEIVEVDLAPPAEEEILRGLEVRQNSGRRRHPRHFGMKDVAGHLIELARRNHPLDGVPRDDETSNSPALSDSAIQAALCEYLRRLFSGLQSIEGLTFQIINFDEAAQDAAVEAAVANCRSLDMHEQASKTAEMYEAFKANRRLLAWILEQGWLRPGACLTPTVVKGLIKLVEHTMASNNKNGTVNKLQGVIGFMAEHGLLRPNTVIPIGSFVDLSAAAPVWYFALEGAELRDAQANLQGNPDPLVHPATRDMIELLPGNERWAHWVQIWNRRCRPLQTFNGDVIPAKVARLIALARGSFDRVAIATPYLDKAGSDWQDERWLRSIDPFVLGFKKGCPVFFVLARFSDLGVFPLLEDMVADTMNYLKLHIDQLRNGFNQARAPYWYTPSEPNGSINGLGDVLYTFAQEALKAYEAGRLFDWLRKEWDIPTGEIVPARETASKSK